MIQVIIIIILICFQLEGFEMQVYLLRQLLNAEKNRIKTANQNVHELLHKLEENNKDRTEMIKVIEILI